MGSPDRGAVGPHPGRDRPGGPCAGVLPWARPRRGRRGLPADHRAPDGIPGAANGTLHLTVGGAALEGFSSPLTLTALDLPAGVTASFSPNPLVLPGTSDLTLTAGPGLVVDDFNVNVAATGGGVTHFASAPATLDFDLAREPAPPCQGSVDGFLRDSRTGDAIANTSFSGSFLGTTDSTGHYGPFDWPTGTYSLTAEDQARILAGAEVRDDRVWTGHPP